MECTIITATTPLHIVRMVVAVVVVKLAPCLLLLWRTPEEGNGPRDSNCVLQTGSSCNG